MTISRESLRLGSFFVSSQPNMMSFTASLSNRFGAWQNRGRMVSATLEQEIEVVLVAGYASDPHVRSVEHMA